MVLSAELDSTEEQTTLGPRFKGSLNPGPEVRVRVGPLENNQTVENLQTNPKPQLGLTVMLVQVCVHKWRLLSVLDLRSESRSDLCPHSVCLRTWG